MLQALKNKIEAARKNIVERITVSDDVRQERFDICKSCDKLTSAEFCKICHCYMPAKTWIPSSNCPIKKWIAVENVSVNHK